MTGTVVYIHPLGRFHIVEFELRSGRCRRASRGQKTDEEDGHDVSI